MPLAWVAVPTEAAEFVQLPAIGDVASSLITRAVGTAGVSVLLARSFFAESETKPFGVTGQEQQDTSCSSGVKAYTLAQSAPVIAAVVPACRLAPRAPAFEMSVTESPAARLAA